MSQLIYQQIPKVMADIDAISKSRSNTQQGYKFRGIDEVYNEVHSVFSKHKIFTTTEVLDSVREQRATKTGGQLTYTILRIKFTFYAEDGSNVFCVTVGEGMDSGDKSSNKAMAVAHKYAITQTFVIPTQDDKDPENDSHEVLPKRAVDNFGTPPNKPLVQNAAEAKSGELCKQHLWVKSKYKDKTGNYGEYCKHCRAIKTATAPLQSPEREDNIPF